ncbi:conserved hypothetical protein [Leishmania infantum JPCM5]|uniref:Uncharacterized protein n=2 Tax=Leishmania infantum TaxID=5671 RepID=A4I2D3_LEIIN|nr:conserved hypothetical protein [Leishmania infantum JPCM5]CAC9497398.1 hypothetical_protein_-_conserved [Leishmania infantum]CAM68922.1 conserved hypothetical protein [Leishmania infantum JPCM5]SUZ42798.1 hypothetical_protein_-_conserved [Leishmania infantum]|eukprot:XP_001470544.1 conserved hypothetical protein [Leishmania infantum JPCM5]
MESTIESTLENVEHGIRNALQRLSDARARLATQRSALNENRLVLVRAVSPLLLVYPAESALPAPSYSPCGASDTLLTPLLRGQSAKSAVAAGSSPRHNGLLCEVDRAEDFEDTIIISPAAAARERAPAPPTLLALQPLPPMSSPRALPQASTYAGFYSAMAARTQQLEEQCSSYYREHVKHAAKLQIAQVWAREVQPWFEKVVHRGFFQHVILRLDALNRRVVRLCRRLALDRPQYIPSRQCTIPIRRGMCAHGQMVGEEGHLHGRQPHSQCCPHLAGGVCNRGQTNGLRGVNGQVRSASDDGGEGQAAQKCGCTAEATSLSAPPSQQGRTSDAALKLDSADGNNHPMCSLWRQYIQMVSQPDALDDEHRQAGEESHSPPSPLLRTPRSLRHVWHVTMEGLTSSDAGAVSDSMTAEPPNALPAADSVSVGDVMPHPGCRLHQRGHIDALVRNLSDLVRRRASLHLPLPPQQSTLRLCNHDEHEHEVGCHDGRDDAAGDGRRGATALVRERLPLDTGSPPVALHHSHLCVLLCCAMQLCSLAQLCNAIRAGQPLCYVTPPPQLAYDADVGGCSGDDNVADDGIGGVEVVHIGPHEPMTVSARATDGPFTCQRTCEGQIAEALAAVYHTVPCLLSQLSLALQKRRGGAEYSGNAQREERSEVAASETDEATGSKPCAASAEEDRFCVTNSAADAGAGKDSATGAALWPTVGDAARDRDAFVRRWLSLASSLLTTELPPPSTPLTEVPSVYARVLRVGSLFRSLLDAAEDECDERLLQPAAGAASAVLSPTTTTPLTTARADVSTLATHEIHVAQRNTTAAHRIARAVPASSIPLAATTRVSTLRQMELQTRQQWQSMETSLSVARSMAAAALKRAAPSDDEAGDVAVLRAPMPLA